VPGRSPNPPNWPGRCASGSFAVPLGSLWSAFLCETNPIPGGAGRAGARGTGAGGFVQTKPILRCARKWAQAGGACAWADCAKRTQFARHRPKGPGVAKGASAAAAGDKRAKRSQFGAEGQVWSWRGKYAKRSQFAPRAPPRRCRWAGGGRRGEGRPSCGPRRWSQLCETNPIFTATLVETPHYSTIPLFQRSNPRPEAQESSRQTKPICS
jgi:hypothetical protein